MLDLPAYHNQDTDQIVHIQIGSCWDCSMKYSPIKIPFMHTTSIWFLIYMTEYFVWRKSVFKIEFHGDTDFLVRELLNIRIIDNKYRIFLYDLSSTTPYWNLRSFLKFNLSMNWCVESRLTSPLKKRLSILVHYRGKDDYSKYRCCCRQHSDLTFILPTNSDELY